MKRVLALDYGQKRVGIAISDETNVIATPYKTITNDGKVALLSKLQAIISQQDVGKIVVGIPYHLDGNPSEQTKSIHDFIAALKNFFSIEVIAYDESLSSCEAKEIIKSNRKVMKSPKAMQKNKGLIDKIAAAIVLQNYLNDNSTKKE